MTAHQVKKSQFPLIFAGHSHLVALIGDRHEPTPLLRKLDIEREAYVLDGNWPRSDEYWNALLANAKHTDIALMWGGNAHNVSYFFQNAYEFDFLSSHVSKVVPGLQIIPKSRIMKRFNSIDVSNLERLLRDLNTQRPHSISLLGTPPPKKDNEALRAMLNSEPYFIDWANQIGESVETIRITLPHIRLKLWYLLQEMVREAAKAAGAHFIPIPEETQDEEGFLLPKYWRADVTHANDAYGSIMFGKVVRELS